MSSFGSLNAQPTLANELITIKPLIEDSFEALYAVASDPLVWEQHPNKNRYRREVFHTFFKGALESQGAFVVIDNKSGETIGSSRFYDYAQKKYSSVHIGYTFLGRKYWGGVYNPSLKALMINYALQFVDRVFFQIGAVNFRSQIAIERLGAVKIGEAEIEYYGEEPKLNYLYEIKKESWTNT